MIQYDSSMIQVYSKDTRYIILLSTLPRATMAAMATVAPPAAPAASNSIVPTAVHMDDRKLFDPYRPIPSGRFSGDFEEISRFETSLALTIL